MDKEPTTAPAGAVAVREGGTWGSEVLAQGDLSPAAAAASARARIEARVALVRLNPRDVDVFRARILKDCKRPLFAEKALYRKPVGRKKNAEGVWEEQYAVNFSIRFVEAALQHFMHIHTSASIAYDDARKTLLQVEVLDVQNNVAHSRDIMLEKVVERREVKKGRRAIATRENSYGDLVYLVEATGEEFRNRLGAETSKLLRDNGQRLLPPDILEEARQIIDQTNADENARDPDGQKKKVLDRFGTLGVTADMLKAYLDRDLATLTAKDIAELAVLFNGLRDGEFSWNDAMRVKAEPAEGEAPAADPATGDRRNRLKDKILSAREGKPEAQS